MNFRNRLVCRACVVALGLVLGGCSPSDSGSQNELKEPHFVLGQSRVNAMDYDGAREAFEQSLEVNPHSAQAHFQLAMLYEQKLPDPAAAIYHYERYLKYDPRAGNADVRFSYTSVPEARYLVESSTNLTSWVTERTSLPASSTSTTNVLSGAGGAAENMFRVGVDASP